MNHQLLRNNFIVMNTKIILLFSFLLINKISFSQNWKFWDMSNSNIPSNTITDVAVDASDNVWISTYNGVAKFNGTSWVIYNQSNSPVPNDVCYSIATEGNKVWIGSVWGLVEFDGGATWNVYTSGNSGLPYSYITSIDVDRFGNKWIGSLYIFGMAAGGLTKYDNSNWITYNTSNSDISSDWVGSTFIDHNNTAWIGTNYGLNIFNDTTWTVFQTFNSGIAGNGISSVRWNNLQQQYWIGTTNGLSVYDTLNNWFTYDTSNFMLSNYIRTIEIDRTNKIWISCLSIGIVMYDGSNWQYFDTLNTGQFVKSAGVFAFDSKNNLWVATGYGLAFYGDTTTLNINTYQRRTSLSIFPNPFNDIINLELNDNFNNNILEIFSLNGSLVYSTRIDYLNNIIIPIDLHFLEPGVYLLNLKSLPVHLSSVCVKNSILNPLLG